MRTITAINAAGTTACNYWLLTFSGAATDTQTVTIGGIAFTTVTAIGSTAGNVLIGGSNVATCTNLAAAINNPGTTTSTHVALSAASCTTFNALNLRATAIGATVVLQTSVPQNLTVSETQTNAAWGSNTYASDPIDMDGFNKCSIQVGATGIASGNGVFSVDVSNDGTNWVAYNRITSNATNTNGQTDVRVASVTVSTAGTSYQVALIPDIFAFMRLKVVATTDGTYNAYVLCA